jgi:hypothetical protein
MTQPINRETAIALAKEAGMAGMLTDVVCSLEEIHRLCNLAVAHSRKDAEPVGICGVTKHGGVSVGWMPDYIPQHNDKLYLHPPEADKLLQQALEALIYHTEQTRPILQTDAACRAIRTYLEGKK